MLRSRRAPQHPASHVLHSIPPRAPARSSRSNILSFTLYLSTVSRLSTYSTPIGSGALLHRAESHDPLGGGGDDEWMEQEERSIGLRKTSVALLAASRREGPLPIMVERRVVLATLTDDVLTSPFPQPAPSTTTIQNSSRVESLIALAPLTSPDATTLYDPAVAAAQATSSIAQSLINMKFGGSADGEKLGAYSRQSESVFGMDDGASTSRSKLTRAPHMDYRIVRGQAMKSRAKEIFATSILPTESVAWCRRHRVDGCGVCSTKIADKKHDGKTFRRNFPGQGLSGPSSKKPLVEVVPAFLVFSATLLKDLQERATLSDESDLGSPYVSIPTVPNSTVDGTTAWYSLLHSLTIQACLEGYLVDGWTGTEGIEILFGCGCGVWEGKGWASRVAQSNQAASQSAREKEKAREMDIESESDSESEEDEELEKEQARDNSKRQLLEAAQCLFGSRDEAQAEFERSMRDRTHEVCPFSSTLRVALTPRRNSSSTLPKTNRSQRTSATFPSNTRCRLSNEKWSTFWIVSRSSLENPRWHESVVPLFVCIQLLTCPCSTRQRRLRLEPCPQRIPIPTRSHATLRGRSLPTSR